MDLFEYQGKQFFARYGIPVSPARRSTTVDEAVAAAERIGYPVVVKAQVQVGGRGKAGGIKLAANADEVPRPTPATSSAWTSRATSSTVVWIERATDIAEEYYASLHPRPGGQAAPRDAVGAGRRRDRAGGRRRTPRPSPASTSTRSTGSPRRRPARGSRRAKLNPDGDRRRRRHPPEAVRVPTSTATPTWSRSTR